MLKSITANSFVTSKITIPLFEEVNRIGTKTEMLEMELTGNYDGILGCNVLRPLKAKIDFEKMELITKEASLPLVLDNNIDNIYPCLTQEELNYFNNITLDYVF